jgi:hypothetical protein
MSAKFWLQELREHRASRNNLLNVNAIRSALQHSNPSWQAWKPEEQEKAIQKKRSEHVPEMKKKLAHIQHEITSETKDARAGIDKLKYPLRSSKDIAQVAIGAQQKTNALLFLNSSPPVERIASEIRNAFDSGEFDYGFSLQENCLNDIGKNGMGELNPTGPQKWLQAELNSIYDTFAGKAKIEEQQGELQRYAAAELIAADFAEQETAGAASLVSPELFPYLSEQERSEAMQQMEVRGNITNIVYFKRRVSEAMSKVAVL